MASNQSVKEILNGTIESVKTVIPFDVEIEKPSFQKKPLLDTDLGVLIGVNGDIQGRLVIEGSKESVGLIGERMFGMPLEGEMLESFTGELANMIVGQLATIVSQRNVEIDITPPTLMNQLSLLPENRRSLCVSVSLENQQSLQMTLLIED
ncbi:chemotaxis protein CheX [Pontibacillus yanchengensis]|uniref:Chemotaxis protein CheX n=2 Tax=Pontibacillus yanchengensis TaxID=462910 RepID=A0ACC7VAN0_9BACI|nr:chemotaxis protein CheX [Pontibacillus yanchengensis]MYL32807.1 chemotaxis protein CheX [Pontibacillus yanchengensis]MYL51717.1 chemotaxis protein CheX [Pontibacillus yanchengensis]